MLPLVLVKKVFMTSGWVFVSVIESTKADYYLFRKYYTNAIVKRFLGL